MWKGKHCGQDVAVKVMRTYSTSNLQKIIGASSYCYISHSNTDMLLQKFCKEVIIWKTLQHENILPLIGVTMSESHFAMVSDWMVNGNICEFVEAHPDENRIQLVGLYEKSCGVHLLTTIKSYS